MYDTTEVLIDAIHGYECGYDDGLRNGKIEILNELMNTISRRCVGSEFISRHLVMQLLESRKSQI